MVIRWGRVMELLSGIWDYNVASKFGPLSPKEMFVNLTYRCNSRCIMCNIWQVKVKKEMGLREWKKVVADPIFKDIRSLTLSGGEPVLHPEFDEIAELLVERLPRIKELGLITNGFLTRQIVEKVAWLAEVCCDKGVRLSVSVSLDGVGKVHDGVRRVSGGFKKTEATIIELKKLRTKMNNAFNINVGSIILRQNVDDFDETRRWLEKMEVDHGFQMVGFHETFVNNLETEKKIGFGNSDLNKLVSVLEKLIKFEPMKSYYWNDLLAMYTKGKNRTTPCPLAVDQMVIDGNGDVFYCLSERSIGNFLKEKRSIADIYFDENNLKLRAERWRTVCRKCNSGCNAQTAVFLDVKKNLWYRFTGKVWPK